jgi:hypothetical protein
MYGVANLLIPLFISSFVDVALAREMAVSAIEAYQPATRADYVNIARTIAFSMSALALLGQAAGQDMMAPEKMRAFGRANALSRSADQSERTMMLRHHHQNANPRVEQPSDPALEQVPDDAEVQAAVAEAMREYDAICESARTAAAAAETTPEAVTPAAVAAVDMVQSRAISNRHGDPRLDAGQPHSRSYKDGLQSVAFIRDTVPEGVQPFGAS